MYYFDHAAGQPPNPEICDFYRSQLLENFANPNAPYRMARQLSNQLEIIRSDIKKMIEADEADSLIFTSSATESNNLLIKGLFEKNTACMAVSLAEHPSLIKPLLDWSLESRNLKHKANYQLDESDLKNALDTCDLICLSHINNHTGILQELKVDDVLNKKAHIHWDLSQSFGKKSFSVKESVADSATLSGHKFGVPKGIGVLWLRHGITLNPLFQGGDQDTSMRSSTINFPLISTFHFAAMKINEQLEDDWSFFKKIQKEMIQELQAIQPEIRVPFESETSSPYITTLIVPGPSSDVLMRLLDEQGVVVSTHSACSSRIKKENGVMAHLGFSKEEQQQIIRISFSRQTTREEVFFLIQKWKEIQSTLNLFKKGYKK